MTWQLAILGPLAAILGVLCTLAVQLWRGRRDVAVVEHAQDWTELRDELARMHQEIGRQDARNDLLAKRYEDAQRAYLEERSRSGAARMEAAEERRLRGQCEEHRVALRERVDELAAEVGRLRRQVDELDARQIADIEARAICLVECHHQPTCGMRVAP